MTFGALKTREPRPSQTVVLAYAEIETLTAVALAKVEARYQQSLLDLWRPMFRAAILANGGVLRLPGGAYAYLDRHGAERLRGGVSK